jgi:uncharacterized protein YbcC (UPF0753/DUF2309 family)
MELRALIRLSSEIIAYYWPMRTFVHHNPLHGLEAHHFDEAVAQAHRLLGGKGYLSNEIFRDFVRSGRILPRHLDLALKPLAQDQSVKLAARTVTQLEVLRACFLHRIEAPADEMLDRRVQRHPDRSAIAALAEHLASTLEPPVMQKDPPAETAPGLRATLAGWCDRNLGTRIADLINRESIKWCEAFLDEGHATWSMPGRERGFYQAWKFLARREWSPCGIKGSREKVARLPALPEDALLESLAALGILPDAWQDYLTLHLTALPGWAGFIKWRGDQSDYEWQRNYPIDLVQYLAVRVWYERELVKKACAEVLGIAGHVAAISAHSQSFGASGTKETQPRAARRAAWRLAALAKALETDAGLMIETAAEDLRLLLQWIDHIPESEHGPVWLKAYETGYQEELIGKLSSNIGEREDGFQEHGLSNETGGQGEVDKGSRPNEVAKHAPTTVRPQAQAVFCIDVRSESLRRHLEALGDYETFGFAGFFNAAIRYQSLGSHHETDQFPVILKAKNFVREISRTYQGQLLLKHRARTQSIDAAHTLLHDLKENVATPYVMVESLGWFYGLPMIGKTIFTSFYANASAWFKRTFLRPVATTLTVDKLSRDEVEEMLAAEQRTIARRALQETFGDRQLNLSLERLEFFRRRALAQDVGQPSPEARSHALSSDEETAFVEALRSFYGINQHSAFARAERITRTGFTPGEQTLMVEAALRIMGLTRNFARLVLFCAHGSTSENNPFEAALDCGACGGNPGNPNARVLALVANKRSVREELAKNGIAIPQDTYFIAGQHDTTTDNVDLFDLEDLPPTHRKDLLELIRGLEEAGLRNRQERCARFPEIGKFLPPARAAREVRRRSGDWSQVRPEWGLSRNAAFIIGRRELTRTVDLDGRVFLHSYDYRLDPAGRLLEVVMIGPQVVGQWINMEHYFSTVDQEIYGSGSKIYHNVVGRLGIMAGPQSDLRTGLAWQTVMDGPRPYHEPMRLLTVIEAPRERINQIIRGHRHLQHLYDNQWAHLIAIEPEEKLFYRYAPNRGWIPIPQDRKGVQL